MPKFMIKASYSADGLKGADTGGRDLSAGRSAGGGRVSRGYVGKISCMASVTVTCTLPSTCRTPETAAAISLTIGATGALAPQTIALPHAGTGRRGG